MEIKNHAMVKLLDNIAKYHKELVDKPADQFNAEDKMMFKVITELKAVVDKYTAPKERIK